MNEADKITVCRHIARDYLAPAMVGFTDWFCDAYETGGYNCLILAARAGWLLQRILRVRHPHLCADTTYLYISRASVAPALVSGREGTNSFIELLRYRRSIDVSVFVSRFGLTELDCEEASQVSGMPLTKAIDTRSCMEDVETRLFIEEMARRYFQRVDAERQLLASYVRETVRGKRAALVDIGWHGSIQRALIELSKTEGIGIGYHGFYLGAEEDDGTRPGRLAVKGYLLKSLSTRSCFYRYKVITSLTEFVLNAPHGTTLGYDTGPDGLAIPVLAPYEYRVGDGTYTWEHRALLAMHDEIVKYAEIAPMSCGVNAAMAQANALINLLERPTSAQLLAIGELRRMDYDLQPLAQPLNWRSYLRRPKSLACDFSHAGWKLGFLMRLSGTYGPSRVLYRAMLGVGR